VRKFVEAGAAPQRPASPVLAVSAPEPRSDRPSIAVLPFINRSEVKKDDVFAHGMVEDLTAALSLSPWMNVVAASATAVYRKGARDLRQIGRDLGVRYLLEGNVRRAGECLRITAQLLEAESERILSTQKFERPLDELAALQDELVTEVAAHLGVQVLRAEMEHALKKPGNVGPWEAMMRADAYATYATRAGWEAAAAEAKRGIEHDPTDGFAYSLLASAQGMLLLYRGGNDPELAQEIVQHIRRAQTLAPNNPDALARIAGVLLVLGKAQDALPLAERAVTITPHHEIAHLMRGMVLVKLGRPDETLAELDTAEHLAPNSPYIYYCSIWRSVAHLQAGRLDQALEAADRAVRLLPATESLIQSLVCWAMNRSDRAHDALRRLRETDPDMSWAALESLLRFFHSGSDAVGDYVAAVCKVWDKVPGDPGSP
jgi:TolB-like protein/Tfp pilus assembly protein PilF